MPRIIYKGFQKRLTIK